MILDAQNQSSCKMATVTFLYPATPSASFNLSYYLNNHMPLVQNKWVPFGLKSWTVTRLDPKSGYIVQCTMFWESLQHWENGMKEEGEEVIKDMGRYTNIKPIRLAGEVIASS